MKIMNEKLNDQLRRGFESRLPDNEDASIGILVKQIALAKATELARTGRYSEAEKLLTETSRREDLTPAILDLLARIRTQQGRLSEAESFWTEATRLDPTNEAYKAGLRRIAKMQRRPVWITSILNLIVGLIILLCLVIIEFAMKSYVSASLRFELSKYAVTPRLPSKKIIDLKLEIPGVFITAKPNETIITFTEGLFVKGIILKPEAKTLLTALGRQLEPYIENISKIDVIGHTDSIQVHARSVYRDNIALGRDRANIVIEHLRLNTNLPFSIFYACSFGESMTLYDNDTPDNRSRNRTVVIRVHY
jgi:flagellar motor protein MotB